MSRKGAFEVPINWIYVIIVGGFVIFFFTRISLNNAHNSQEQNAAEITKFFDTALESFATASNTMGNANLPLTSFSVNNTAEGVSVVRYRDKYIRLKESAFSPSELKGNISYWTYPFSTGYASSQMLFLSDSNRGYKIISNGDDKLVKKLKDYELPNDYSQYFTITFNDYTVGSVSVQGGNSIEYKTVCINPASTDPQNMCDITVTNSSGRIDEGTVKFKGGGTYYYYNYGMIFAAVFSSGEDNFVNGIRPLIERHNVTGKILIYRAKAMKSAFNNGACSAVYDDAISNLEKIRSLNFTSDKDITDTSPISYIESDNQKLQQNECGAIY